MNLHVFDVDLCMVVVIREVSVILYQKGRFRRCGWVSTTKSNVQKKGKLLDEVIGVSARHGFDYER